MEPPPDAGGDLPDEDEAVVPMMSVNLEDTEGMVAPHDAAVGAQNASDGGGDEESGLMSGVKVDLIDWSKKARPMEGVLLVLSAILLVVGLKGNDWMVEAFNHIHAGLSCHLTDSEGHPSAVCVASGVPAVLGWTAFSINVLLGTFYVVELLDERGLLASLREKLPPSVPLDKAVYVPIACWVLMLIFVFLTLLVYALLFSSSLNGGLAQLGSSYGALRLDLLLVVLGFSVHLSLVHKVGEDHVVEMLDSLRGHWGHMSRRQQVSQVLLLFALLCDALLWLRRVEWGALLIIYGLWAHSQNSHEHLSIFCCGAIFSACTDALALASDPNDSTLVEVLSWCLLLTKLVVVSILVSSRSAFV